MPHRYDNQHAQQADESRKTGGCPLRAERRSRSGPSDQTKPARAGRRSRSGPANQTKPARAGATEPQRASKPNQTGTGRGGGAGAGHQTRITESGHAAYALFGNAYR